MVSTFVFIFQCLICCLEFQFDTVITDRTMILHKLFLLSTVLKDQEVLSWDFFLNRFDTLCLEAQLDLDNGADESSLQGCCNIISLFRTLGAYNITK